MRGDRNIRDYYISPKVVSTPLGTEVHTMNEFLVQVKNPSKYSFYSFETKPIDGLTNNILNDYLVFLTDKTDCFDKFKFDSFAARHFEFKSRSIAKYLYGDTSLFYFIFVFNDISHDSDLSYDYLVNHGLIMPNVAGIELIKKLLVFKNKTETVSGVKAFAEPVDWR